MHKNRIDHIDRVTGVAIFFVVLGHMYFPELRNIAWYVTLRNIVYKVHMPLFIFVSGFIAFLSVEKKRIDSLESYKHFTFNKIKRFLPPYLFFGIISLAVDSFIYNHTILETLNDVFALFFSPINGSAEFLWYLYVLFSLYLITPFLLKISFNSIILLMAASFHFTNFDVSPLFSTSLLMRYFFFFIAGGITYLHHDYIIHHIKRRGGLYLIIFILSIIIDIASYGVIPFQFMSLLFIISILYVCLFRWPFSLSNVFEYLGVSAFAIYLFNSSILNVLYLLIKYNFEFITWDYFILIGLISGIGLPILIRYFFNHIIPQKIYRL
jgi:fucose 4-O-acetylase-like acetyltransferase